MHGYGRSTDLLSYPYRNDKVVQACDKIVTRLQQGCVQ